MKPRDGSPPPEPLGERIRRLRREKGWTQRDLALRAGLKPAQISKYERGNYQPGLAALKAIADALGTTTDHLVGSGPETDSDPRLKSLLSRVWELPPKPRSSIAEILDGLLKIHRYLDTTSPSRRQRKPKKT
jgi:transcriptional regulator with XRE-family HTH domain